MTILQKLRNGDAPAEKRWHGLGATGAAVRPTDVSEHETFAEEQARWERSDPEYARLCEAVRQARDRGEEASQRADEAKAEWDARVASQRRANDDARGARMPRLAIRAREARHHMHTTFAIESNRSPGPGSMPEPVRLHDHTAAMTAPPGDRQAAGLCVRGPATRNPVSDEPPRPEVV